MEADAGKDQDRVTRDVGRGRPQYPAPTPTRDQEACSQGQEGPPLATSRVAAGEVFWARPLPSLPWTSPERLYHSAHHG